MSDKVCVLCFSFAKNIYDIKNTNLQNVYEEIFETKIQADSYPLCYVCYTKLFKFKQLFITIQQHNNANQAQVRPLLLLSMLNTDSWSTTGQIDFGKIEIEIQIEINKPYIKKEHVESPGHYDNESTAQQNKPISTNQTRIQDNSEPNVCNICNKTFSYANNLKKHQLTCIGVNPYRCEVCSVTFTHTGSFKRHKLTHTGEKPYGCDVCANKYKRKKDLKMHYIMKHRAKGTEFVTDDNSNTSDNFFDSKKRYACDTCNMRFVHLYKLKKHQLTHSGIKAYSCDECGKKFSNIDILKSHHLTHSNLKPFSCDVCPKAYKRKYDLYKHKRKHKAMLYKT